MKLIGIAGAAGSGKDSAADFIITSFGGEKVALADPLKHFCRTVLGFSQAQLWGPSEKRNAPDPRFTGDVREATCSQARRQMVAHGGAWIQQVLPHFNHAKRQEALAALRLWLEDCLRQIGLSTRYALQTLGTEWGRAQDQDMWLRFAEADAVRRDIKGYVLITDVRFLSEAAFMSARQASLLAVVRPGHTGGAQALAAGRAQHASETERTQNADAFNKFVTHTIINDGTLDDFKEKIWDVLSPGKPWPAKPTKPSDTTTRSIPIASDMVVAPSSPSTSSVTVSTKSNLPFNTKRSSSGSPHSPKAAEPKKPSDSSPKKTPETTSGSGPKTEPKPQD